jgi:hypothetical protein
MNSTNLLTSLALATLAACTGWLAPDMHIPQALVPAAQASSERLAARGVQIYECRSTPDAQPKTQWVFVAPEAELFDLEGKRVGRHFAGPHWEADDGSRIVGATKARSDAPQAGAIPWLLLAATSEGAEGRFAKVAHVQRINTVGGVAPASACDAKSLGSVARVPYTADYVFLQP